MRTSPSLVSVLQKRKQLYVTHNVQAHYRDNAGERSFCFRFFLDDHHEYLCDEGAIDLDADGVLTFAPEVVQWKVLFDLFEEQFNHPPMLVDESHLDGGYFEVIGYEVVHLAIVWIFRLT